MRSERDPGRPTPGGRPPGATRGGRCRPAPASTRGGRCRTAGGGGRRPGATPGSRRAAAPRLLRLVVLPATLVLLVSLPAAAGAQEDPVEERIRESQERLEQIRKERERLRREMDRLETQVHAIESEIQNLEQRIGQSASLVAELDAQIQAVEEQISITNQDLLRTRDRLGVARVELRERLVEIYKRGPMGAVQVLLESDSFGQLIHRFKYLHLVALHDRVLVDRVTELERRLEEHRRRLDAEHRRLERLKGERSTELSALESLENQRRRRLSSYSDRRSRTASRLTQLAQEEEKLRTLLEELERARREAERRSGRRTESTLRTSDLGSLDWPVEGRVVYGFGPERTESGTVTRDGIGIGADPGTPVRAIESGEVVFAGPRGLYGPSVIVSHGGGYYSLYLYLRDLNVTTGRSVQAGQILGTVGGTSSPEGAHVEFQIREPGSGGLPRAVDPVQWLRQRSGGGP